MSGGVKFVVTAMFGEVFGDFVSEIVECFVSSSGCLMWFFGKKQLKSGVCIESVVPMHAETLDELEGLSVGKNVVSSCACAGGMCIASVLVVDSSPLGGMGSYVEAGLATKVIVENLYVFGFGIKVAEYECGSIRVAPIPR